MQLQIRSEPYLDYLWEINHSSLSQETKVMLYEALDKFEKEFNS